MERQNERGERKKEIEREECEVKIYDRHAGKKES